MSERGVFAVDRGVWEHPMFAPEPYTEREAWLWMISAAVWKASRVRAGRKVVDLARGQLVFSERFLAVKWNWPKSTVRRFLDRLKNETMVTTLADRDATLITICNYEKYAFDGTTRGPRTGPQSGPLPDHSRTKEEELKKDNNKELKLVVARAPKDERFEELRKAYPKRKGSDPGPPAAKLFLAAIKAGTEPQIIIDGARRFAVEESQNINTPYIPQLVKWLRDRRWLDTPALGLTNSRPDIRSSLI